MARLLYISHPEVVIDPDTPVPDWGLSEVGRARMKAFAASEAVAGVTAIWSSDERKAREAAEILGRALGLPFAVDADLGENDRSATGYLPREEFERTADVFFAAPETSIRGWERAVDAQARILRAVGGIAAAHAGGDLAVVAHGGVGALLWAGLSKRPISRAFDAPSQGQVWTASLPDLAPLDVWRPI